MNDNMLFCSLTTDMSDDELKTCIHKMHPRAIQNEQGFLLTIGGYDEDPRELWEIPEAVEFCKRLIDIGFISVLAPAAQLLRPGTGGFGALEVLFIATGRIKEKAEYPVTKEDIHQLEMLTRECNAKCEVILSQSCPKTDIETMEAVLGKPKADKMSGELKRVNVDDLKVGPIRHKFLTPEVLERVDFVFQYIGRWMGNREVFETDLMRDMHPEREIKIWVRVALAWHKYHALYLDSKVQSNEYENRLVGNFIGLTCGVDRNEMKLTDEEYHRMVECYKNTQIHDVKEGQHRHGEWRNKK